jgi:hypothetical protein
VRLLTAIVLLLACGAVAASAGTRAINMTLSPARVHRGAAVTIRGHAGDCPRGDAVTILSHAFRATHSFAGVPAVYARVGPGGAFHTTTTIPRVRHTGRYTVTARCGGGNLGVAPVLAVLR